MLISFIDVGRESQYIYQACMLELGDDEIQLIKLSFVFFVLSWNDIEFVTFWILYMLYVCMCLWMMHSHYPDQETKIYIYIYIQGVVAGTGKGRGEGHGEGLRNLN